MADLSHNCGLPIRPDGTCPLKHQQCQRCPDHDEIRRLCEELRATWSQHRLDYCEQRREPAIELVRQVGDGMVRRENRRGVL